MLESPRFDPYVEVDGWIGSENFSIMSLGPYPGWSVERLAARCCFGLRVEGSGPLLGYRSSGLLLSM